MPPLRTWQEILQPRRLNVSSPGTTSRTSSNRTKRPALEIHRLGADHRYVNGSRHIADRASCPLGVPTTRPGFVQKAPTAYPRRSNDSEHGIRKEIADAKSADESRARGKMWGFGILRNLFLRECADYS